MPLLWCSISSHGFGHAAQVIPVLNELGRLIPRLTVILRTQVPEWFFRNWLAVEWTYSPAPQDIGCIQRGSLWIEVAATWKAHLRFHQGWEGRVQEEGRVIRSVQPSLVLSDISYLAVEAGAAVGIPAVGLCNLTWDRVLDLLAQPGDTEQATTLRRIEHAYALADLMIRPAPGIPLKAFRQVMDIGPIADPVALTASGLREAIGAMPGDRIVLIGFGGIALDSPPFEQLEQMAPYRFIVSGPVPARCTRTRSVDSTGVSFRTVFASADLIVTKPGYSTVVEAVVQGKPVVYVRRYNFADEATLVAYLHRYGRAAELTEHDFTSGLWQHALDAAWAAPPPRDTPPPPTGAMEGARILSRYL